ncbi:MAG TPA: 6-phosphogluconolactonase [Candidatus Polarisedimenticolaceae bacterium]|nr:6-phosphogluconolactonase [Candidatus Polarisedimenticolaceae bacterium]
MNASVEAAPVEILRERFAERVERGARRAVADRGSFTLALSGGSAATVLLPRLVRAAVDWRRVDVFWIDERAVPQDDPESNAGAAMTAFIRRVPLRTERVHVMPAASPDLAAAAEEYERTMRRVLGGTPAFDLVFLGMGPDGHVASLFPGHPLLEESRRWVAAVTDSPKPPPARLTVTMPVLQSARETVLFVTGTEKGTKLAGALRHPENGLPVARALDGPGTATILVDEEAGSALQAPIR